MHIGFGKVGGSPGLHVPGLLGQSGGAVLCCRRAGRVQGASGGRTTLQCVPVLNPCTPLHVTHLLAQLAALCRDPTGCHVLCCAPALTACRPEDLLDTSHTAPECHLCDSTCCPVHTACRPPSSLRTCWRTSRRCRRASTPTGQGEGLVACVFLVVGLGIQQCRRAWVPTGQGEGGPVGTCLGVCKLVITSRRCRRAAVPTRPASSAPAGCAVRGYVSVDATHPPPRNLHYLQQTACTPTAQTDQPLTDVRTCFSHPICPSAAALRVCTGRR